MQDSLGGNSKTMIIANVSPSMRYACFLSLYYYFLTIDCLYLYLTIFAFFFSSAIETLNTLKFAQRAKLIQNNVRELFLFMLNAYLLQS